MKLIVLFVIAISTFSVYGREIPASINDGLDRTGRIVGGDIVTPHSHPYIAALRIQLSLITSSVCGGSLVTTRSVLTSANCIDNTLGVTVILGAHNMNNNGTVEPSQQRFSVTPSYYRIHPDYVRQTLLNDIAILILPSEAVLNEFVAVAAFPPLGTTDTYAGQVATVSGWGRTSDSSTQNSPYLRSTSNQVITNAECATRFGAMVTESSICMSSVGGRGACTRDWGGPMTIQQAGRTIQIGVISFNAAAGCERGIPVKFSRITSFRQWIIDNQNP